MRGSSGTRTYLAQTQTISTSTRAILEVNQNRWHQINPVSDAVYAAGDYLTYFKNKFAMEDVVLPNRPPAGACRPRFGRYSNTKVQRGATLNNIASVGTYVSAGDYWKMPPRLYTTNTDPAYRYFTSQSTTGTFGVTYATNPYANKIVVGLENTFEWPLTWVIQVKISGTWTTIATNPAIDHTTNPKGQVSVYRVGGSWTLTEPDSPALADAVAIQGIQIITYTMNSATAHTNIIELSPRLQVDITPYLQTWSFDENLSAQDLLAPVGVISSNGGSAVFSNSDQQWEKYLAASGASIKDFAVDDTTLIIKETINSETMKIVTARCKDWTVSEGQDAKTNLFDRSVVLQAVSCPDLLMASVTPTMAMVRLLDQVGSAGYKIRRVSGEVEPIIPYFFCSKDDNVWDVLQALCYSQQYALWLDADDEINIATKNWIYNNPTTPTWSFRAENDGSNYADIESHDMSNSEPVNSVTINFQEQLQSRGPSNNTSQYLTAGLKTGAVADVEFETRNLWDSNRRSVLLGCVNITQPIGATDTTITVDVNAFRNDMWDFPVGYAYVDDEVIKLGAARFGYMNTSAVYTEVDLETIDDWKLMMADAIGNVSFTGKFVNCERGQFGTTAAAHPISLAGWNYVAADAKSFSLIPNSVGNGFLRINKANAAVDYKTSIWRDLGTAYGAFYTKFTLLNQSTPQRAGGVVLWANPVSNVLKGGWYVEFRSTEKQKNEIAIVRITSTGALDRAHQQVFSADIKESVYYSVKIVIARSTKKGYHRISVYLDDVLVCAAYVLTSQVTPSTKVALMATGRSIIQFDYLAAANGAISAGSYNNHVRNILRTVLEEKKSAYQGVNMYYSNFDSKLRGIYVETARLSNAPALKVSMFPTINDPKIDKTQQGRWIARSNEVIPALDAVTPFSAKVAIGNVASRPVALDDGTASIYPYLYGPVVETSATVKITSKNDALIQKHGEKKLELSPKWMTTRKNAQDLADYICQVKGDGMETHSINCFDNPLIELGDKVTIYYPRRGLNYDHTYVVTGVSRSEDTGIATSVKLVKIA